MRRYALLAQLVTPRAIARVVPDDPDDDAVIACALAVRAEAIVSGDSDLLKLKEHQGIRIINPAQAFDLITQAGGSEGG